ncbi:MAG: permease-like cell division protein FtsX [Myxococcales bacterium]|nr:permease-like cell division protein FtsX [Myxococcales bacterium]
MSAPAKLAYFVRTAVGSIVRSPFVHVIAVASLSLSLVGFGVARIARTQLDALVDSLGGEVEMTVYLAEDAPEAQVAELEQALAQRTAGELHRVSPAEALGRLATQLGEDGTGLTELPDNPLPWSLEVRLPKAARDAVSLGELARKTRALPFVTGVDYGEEALERLTLIARALEIASLVVFSLVFLTAVIVVSATLQLAIFARREEIEIQKLVGATDRFVRLPFLLEGLLQGLLAAGLALGAVFALVRWLESGQTGLLAFARLDGRLVVQWPRLAGELVGIGCSLGLVGSFIAVRRFLRV